MHDIKFIRDNPALFDAGLARRGLDPKAAVLLALDQRRRQAQTRFQEGQARRNEASREIGVVKQQGGDASVLMEEVAALKQQLGEYEALDKSLGEEIDALLLSLPNLPADDVPWGGTESDNLEVRRIGTPPAFAFTAREHDAIGESLGLMDFAAASRMSGSRFVVLKGALARLERALGAFMLDLQVEQGYLEISPPVLVRDQALIGTGQLPKFAEDLFRTETGHYLIPTAEVPLTNLVQGDLIDEARLPLRFAALTPCFRSEAGASGKDTRGMIRQHQFTKVEMVSITDPDHSDAEHDRMTACAEAVLQRLGLAYRVMLLCSGDLGFSARKTFDIEVWLPGQNCYREISSCSNCGDFQARRMNSRVRGRDGKANRFLHSLNGSGLAVGRTLVAVLENYQQEDGSVMIPQALRPYMGGLDRIRPDV
jgi:seryl-tRNA synthetase